jgi:hypothetical protein
MGLGVSRTRTDLVVNAFAQEAYRWGAFEVWNPQAWKPVIHVQDAAATVSLASAEGWTGTINVASRCLRERDIAELVRLQTGAGWTSPPGKSSGPTRSTRVSCAKLETMLAGHPRWREVPEAVAEFAGRTPTPEDRIHPWN